MPLFRCDTCGTVENTALANYWARRFAGARGTEPPKLCSACDPTIGVWHGRFPRQSAEGWFQGCRGIYRTVDEATDAHDQVVGQFRGRDLVPYPPEPA